MKRERTLHLTSDFPDVLISRIKFLGLNYSQAARRVNEFLPEGFSISNVSLSAYANRKYRPRRIEVVHAIIAAFDIDPHLLIEGVDCFSKETKKEVHHENDIIRLHKTSDNRVRIELNIIISTRSAKKIHELLHIYT